MLIGAMASLGIVLSLAGVLHPIEIPARYKASYGPIGWAATRAEELVDRRTVTGD
jgi:hypothetical protein